MTSLEKRFRKSLTLLYVTAGAISAKVNSIASSAYRYTEL